MDIRIAKDVIEVIRAERKRRIDRLADEDPDYAYDQWLFTDEPFINDMCLMVLVALRHQAERGLMSIAARAGSAQTMPREEYWRSLDDQRKRFRNRKGQDALTVSLNLESIAAWKGSMETLRLLANCLKHEPTQEPDPELLEHLKLPLKPSERLAYAPLSESRCFREGLAAHLQLPKDADYCVIAETFVYLVDQFLAEVERGTHLARITGAVSLSEFVC